MNYASVNLSIIGGQKVPYVIKLYITEYALIEQSVTKSTVLIEYISELMTPNTIMQSSVNLSRYSDKDILLTASTR